jgi:hypothetical protein
MVGRGPLDGLEALPAVGRGGLAAVGRPEGRGWGEARYLEEERRESCGVLDLLLSVRQSDPLPDGPKLRVIRPELLFCLWSPAWPGVTAPLCLWRRFSSSSAFFSPAARRMRAAFVSAGFLMEPRPEAFLESVVALASVCGSQSRSRSPASPWRR